MHPYMTGFCTFWKVLFLFVNHLVSRRTCMHYTVNTLFFTTFLLVRLTSHVVRVVSGGKPDRGILSMVPLTLFVVVVMVHVPPSHFSRHIAYQTRSKHLPSLQNSVRETWKRSLLQRACFSLWSSRRNITHSHFLFGVVGVPCYA